MNSFLKNSFVPRFILAILLAGGALVVWGLAIGTLGRLFVEGTSRQQVVENLQITSSGQAIVEAWRAEGHDPHLFLDLARRPVVLADVEPRLAGQTFAQHNSFLRSHTLEAAQNDRQWPVRGTLSIRGLHNGDRPGVNWFLMNVDEPADHAYLVGFDQRSKQCVGYIGVRGFRLDKPPTDEQFAIGARPLSIASEALHSNWVRAISYNRDRTPLLIISDDKLYVVDLQFAAPQFMVTVDNGLAVQVDRTVRQLPLDEPVVSMGFVLDTVEAANDKSDVVRIDVVRMLVRTPARVLLLDMNGKTLRSAEIPSGIRDRRFSVYVPVGDEIVFQVDESDDNQYAIGLNWVNTNTGAAQSERIVMRRKEESPHQFAWVVSMSVPSPAALAIFYYAFLPAERRAQLRPIDAAEIWNATWPAFLLVCLFPRSRLRIPFAGRNATDRAAPLLGPSLC